MSNIHNTGSWLSSTSIHGPSTLAIAICSCRVQQPDDQKPSATQKGKKTCKHMTPLMVRCDKFYNPWTILHFLCFFLRKQSLTISFFLPRHNTFSPLCSGALNTALILNMYRPNSQVVVMSALRCSNGLCSLPIRSQMFMSLTCTNSSRQLYSPVNQLHAQAVTKLLERPDQKKRSTPSI